MKIEDEILKYGVNLTNCDREPIHIPGSIQPHGVLLGVDSEDVIQVVSANSRTMLGKTPEELLRQPLQSIFSAADLAKITVVRNGLTAKHINPIKLNVPAFTQQVDGILHYSNGLLILELEPLLEDQQVGGPLYINVQSAVAKIQATVGVEDLCDVLAQEVRNLTGFDRVMIYRFDHDWHGEVVSEAKRPDLESFLGLHYPASDIPVQARKLYESNWLRLIYDVHYKPSPLVPNLNPRDNSPIDLSHAVLRSVSPIHCEYLRNMGVSASMSISLMRDGTSLWGLVACHHYSSKLVPYEVRKSSEFLGQTLSLIVSTRERQIEALEESKVEQLKTSLLQDLSKEQDFMKGLNIYGQELLTLVNSTGACVWHNGKMVTFGITPTEDQIRSFLTWLDALGVEESFYTDSLANQFQPAKQFADIGSGVLAVPLGATGTGGRIIWFRQEQEKTVEWAGRPDKVEENKDESIRLSPRGSFALWRQTVRMSAERWSRVEIRAALSFAQAINAIILKQSEELQKLNIELAEAARAKDEFLAIVSHELRTPLNAILGWTELLQQGDLTPQEYPEAFATIRRNATSQQQLVEDLLDVSRIISGKMHLSIEEINPESIIKMAVDAVKLAADAKRIRLYTLIDSFTGTILGDATRIQQIVWNLLSNAVKFTPKEGQVTIRLKKHDSNIQIIVSDNGEGISPEFLPHVFERFKQASSHVGRRHQGLGLGLSIVRHLVELHGGSISAHSEGVGRGATFSILLPMVPVKPKEEKTSNKSGDQQVHCPPELKGLRILVVDDEADARTMIKRTLEKCETEVFVAETATDALALLTQEKPDVLVSDIGMPEVDGYAFIELVRNLENDDLRKTPAIALTAFARPEDRMAALQSGFTTHIAKPIMQGELFAVVASVSGRNLQRKR